VQERHAQALLPGVALLAASAVQRAAASASAPAGGRGAARLPAAVGTAACVAGLAMWRFEAWLDRTLSSPLMCLNERSLSHTCDADAAGATGLVGAGDPGAGVRRSSASASSAVAVGALPAAAVGAARMLPLLGVGTFLPILARRAAGWVVVPHTLRVGGAPTAVHGDEERTPNLPGPRALARRLGARGGAAPVPKAWALFCYLFLPLGVDLARRVAGAFCFVGSGAWARLSHSRSRVLRTVCPTAW